MKQEISLPLAHVCNLSLASGVFPDPLKIAKIIPIHKKNALDEFNNYRPISVLPAFSKIIEKLIYNRMIDFLDKHKILSNCQFGFRKGLSTDLAITTLTEHYYRAIENNNYLVGAFLDLSRAFDTIPHAVLLKKLANYGIRGVTLTWMSDYLTNRKQYVHYNNCSSRFSQVRLGVPQGSILGPLLFLLFINDFPNISPEVEYILYADDSNIFISGPDLDEITDTLSNVLNKIHTWINSNQLILNIEKSNFMIFSSPRKKYDQTEYRISIGNSQLTRVDQCTFLGVILDDKFTWIPHIKSISNKISKGIGILKRAKNHLYDDTILVLYNSLIKPHFQYCITCWGNTSLFNLNRLFLLQKKIVRVLTKSEFRAHSKPLFDTLDIMDIHQLRRYFVGVFVYKCLNGIHSGYVEHLFEYTSNLRSPKNLKVQYFSKKTCQNSIRYVGPDIWNDLSVETKNSMSIYSFKVKIKKDLRN